ncbi:hypothetical protein Kpol_1070p8 [Vanderwaltozyma polyspora DSM 70294]|uniref:SWR1-complex protein 3 n=1 Tax=Vanderwaltozyma polyspora (strain ATCC 22028 / DSM 70294 / BCRC 21397 / CBS 2163 / NBRC 10782 / NRRL Y-8283 / UCD 57-17) TaxID=436907 RepID=A7TNK9_VANPO|nr:uncharacterized protein Kpol_1070p8 [Vanderwaltozyma polyspora DSM 70294]EDO16126.1 hypothetical protein Kpol_1070p8 [Vanderwaltozyma polyspora DSM 70294]
MPVKLRNRVKKELDLPAEEQPSPVSRRGKRKRRNGNDDDDDADKELDTYGQNSTTIKNNVTGRPFELVSDLPASTEIPQYNSALVHPLSVKNSGVLYNSLITSRNTWTHGEMFEVYWTKPIKTTKDDGTNIKEDDTNNFMIRERMQKMCDCRMIAGPHTFPARLFILKNEQAEIKWQEEQDLKKKMKEDKKKNDAEEKKKRMEERKQKQLIRKQEKEKKAQLQKEMKLKVKAEQEMLKLKKKEEQKRIKEEQKKLKKAALANKVVKPAATSTTTKKAPTPAKNTVNDPKMIANLNLMAQRNPKLNNLMSKVAKGEATLEQVEKFKFYIEVARNMPAPPGWKPPTVKTPKPQLTTETKSKPSTSKSDTSKEAVESPKGSEMKLDSKDSKQANAKDVKSDENEVSVSDEKAMSNLDEKNGLDTKAKPNPETQTSNPDSKTENNNDSKTSAEEVVNKNGTKNSGDNSKEEENGTAIPEKDNMTVPKEDDNQEVLTSRNEEKFIDNEEDLSENDEDSPDSKESTADIKEENKDISEITESRTEKKSDKPKRKGRKSKDPEVEAEEKEMQLTAFQLKYVDDSELVLEYQEYTNSRYRLPREAIIELVEGEENEFILSWILVHNSKEINRYKNRRIKDLLKGVRDEEKKKTIIDQYNVYEERGCPTPLYTPMTITLKDIHKKYTPIVMNSVDSLEKVQNIMKSILETGTRLTGYNLWYQLDGYEDKDLAENIRYELVEYEAGLSSKRHRRQ